MLRLAGPVVAIQVGMMLMGVVDTIMVGHVSAVALAAVALGNLYFFGLGVFGMGTLLVLDPVVAQAVGARDDPAIARGIQRGFLIALMIGIPATLLLLPAQVFMQNAVQCPGMAYFILRHGRKSDIFFHHRPQAGPLGIAMSQYQFIIGHFYDQVR